MTDAWTTELVLRRIRELRRKPIRRVPTAYAKSYQPISELDRRAVSTHDQPRQLPLALWPRTYPKGGVR